MIHTPIGSTRRILTFPAVHPCEAISSTTLLNSLVNLANNICSLKSRPYASNCRNARQIIRHIQNLSLFLVELNGIGPELVDSSLLGLSELHLIFQKVYYLLEDCTRQDGRLWILMSSDFVANQFSVLIRSVATAIDVLQLESVGISNELKELVQLVIKQARSARFEVDRSDQRAVEDFILILHQFEEGVCVNNDILKRALEYLGISRWSDCDKEMKFLDAEIAIQNSGNSEKRRDRNRDRDRDSVLLSSLIGLLSYSRCVLFDSVDSPKPEEKAKTDTLSGLDLDDFRCPISLEYMIDPVTIETGHTYDRSSILKWFGTGNLTCPTTGEKLASTELVPNLAIKELIHQYCLIDFGIKDRDITRTAVAGSTASAQALKMTAGFLSGQLANGNGKERIKASYEIRLLTKRSIFNRTCLTEAGVIPHLLKSLLSMDSLEQENAIAALLNLSKQSEAKVMIVDNGGLESIVKVLKKGIRTESRQHAAATLFYIVSINKYRKLIGADPDAIPALVELIKDGTHRGKKNAIVALLGILMHSGNHPKVLACTEAVTLLLNLVRTANRDDLVTESLAVLAILAETHEGAIAILRCSDEAVNIIVEALNSSTSGTRKEYCVSLLLALSINGGTNVVSILVKNHSVMGSLYALISGGSSRASKKANALISVLHEFYDKNSASSLLSAERIIRVW